MPTNYSTTKKAVVNGVPAVPTNVDKNLKQYLNNLNELIESKLGIRGNALDRHVTLRELQNAGVVDRIDASGKFSPNAVNSQNRGFTNTGTMGMYVSERQRPFQSCTLTFKHDLGRSPDLVQLTAYCIVAEFSFEVGDEVVLACSTDDGSGSSEGATILKTNTNIIIHVAQNGFAQIVRKDNGDAALLGSNDTSESNANWELEVKAFTFQESTQGN